MSNDDLFTKPWRMQLDNFTPPTRTPWGGRFIIDRIKAGLPLDPDKAAYSVVGESWEISVEPSFPSRVTSSDGAPPLADLIAADIEAALGGEAARRYGGCPLLIKLLDAAMPLSVQVHPPDDYPKLGPGQSGKPESWIIAAARPGAGLYLGLRSGVDRRGLEAALRAGDDLEPLLNFVPVQPGDCFEIEPGTVHSIGAGVTLVEPQIVRPGRQGVTYRFWDWNRRYDDQGREDPSGQPRPLHIERSLAVTRFEGSRGDTFVDSLRRRPSRISSNGSARHEGLIDDHHITVERLSGTGRIAIDAPGLAGIVVVRGALTCTTATATARFRAGESFVLPHRAHPTELDLDSCLAVLARPGRGVPP